MSCQSDTIVIIVVCAIFVVMMILILQESYTPDNREKSSQIEKIEQIQKIQIQNGNQNDNFFYKTGPFFLNENQDGYAIYNAYKKDPNEQPINAPPVDYVNNPPSTLRLTNPIFAIPNPDVTFVNLLNPVRS